MKVLESYLVFFSSFIMAALALPDMKYCILLMCCISLLFRFLFSFSFYSFPLITTYRMFPFSRVHRILLALFPCMFFIANYPHIILSEAGLMHFFHVKRNCQIHALSSSITFHSPSHAFLAPDAFGTPR